MADPSALLARLRNEPRHLDALADLLADEVLAAPARDFVAAERLTPAIVAGLKALAAAPGHAAWIEGRLRDALARARPRPSLVRARLPAELVPLLRAVVRRHYTPSRALVRAVVDHEAMRDLSRTILHTTLLDFARKVGSILPDTSRIPGAGVTSRLFGVAKGVATGVASVVGLDAQLEDRVRSFVDGAVGRVIDMIVDRATDPRNAASSAAWRADVLAAVLELPESAIHAEIVKLDPAQVAADLQAGLVAVASWDRLPAEIDEALGVAAASLGDATVGALLAGSGVAEAWRALLVGELRHSLGRLAAGERFATWIAELASET